MSKKHNYFIEGAITPTFIGQEIGKHSAKTDIGAHAIFLGQVRADTIDGRQVIEIEYTAYQELAEAELNKLREEILGKYKLRCLHIYHSLGKVKVGEISLFLFVSSAHRQDSIAANAEMIELFKQRIPIWKKEIYEDGTVQYPDNQTTGVSG